MLFDARTLPDRSVLQAELCIVGAGPAGITIAREFLNAGVKVILLEGGGTKFNHRDQLLYRGESSGRSYPPLEFTRRRQLGGTSVLWSGRCRPLDESDFEERTWIPHSGWPFPRKVLDEYYSRAHTVCELGDYEYSPDYWKSNPALGLSSDLEVKMFQFSPPTNFGTVYLAELEHASNLQVFLNANAVHLALEQDGGSVAHLECKTFQHKSFHVKATVYVLAMGGLEIPRLLLASHDVQTNGIGNGYDLVGRFFMEHPFLAAGVATSMPAEIPQAFLRLNYEIEQRHLAPLATLSLSAEKMRDERLLNSCAYFVKRPLYKLRDAYHSRTMTDFKQVNDILRHASAPSTQIFPALGRSALGAARIAPTIARIILHKISPTFAWGIRFQLEAGPNAESRVVLSEKKDALGLPRLDLKWQLTGQDLHSYRRFEELLFAALAQSGIQARCFDQDVDASGWPVTLQIGKHHMGTTRMDKNPRRGVVDDNGSVHSTANLFVASSSVFPTSGMANPTLTIVALSIRLADHIKKALAV